MRIALVLLLTGCTGAVNVVGTIMSGPPDTKARPLEGANIRIVDDQGFVFDTAVSNSEGVFRVQAPRGEQIYAVIDGDGLVASSFTGVSGFENRLDAERALFAVSAEQVAEWEALYAGCPGLEEPGGLVIGEVRDMILVDDATDEHPTISTAKARTQSRPDDEGNTVRVEGCYLADDGTAYSAEADDTGPAGAYAIAGV